MLVYHYDGSDDDELIIPSRGYTLTGTPFDGYNKLTTFPDRFECELDEDSNFTSMFVVPDEHLGKPHEEKMAH